MFKYLGMFYLVSTFENYRFQTKQKILWFKSVIKVCHTSVCSGQWWIVNWQTDFVHSDMYLVKVSYELVTMTVTAVTSTPLHL